MIGCDRDITLVLHYLDGSLRGPDLAEFRAHVAACSECRQRLEEEFALSSILREARPLFTAPATLRARMNVLVEEALTVERGLSSGRTVTEQPSRRRLRDVVGAARGWRILAAAAIAIALALALLPNVFQRLRSSDYVAAAAQIHQNYVIGAFPLQCNSRSPEVVTSWFAGKTAFRFQLPAAQSILDSKARYWLTGGRLVTYKRSPAALVEYETPQTKISLLIASSQLAIVGGGEIIRSGDITFHYKKSMGFEVITWNNHDLAYALVSSPLGSARHPCLVCHGGMSDHIASPSSH
jgi:anti-sigma factor RsiW